MKRNKVRQTKKGSPAYMSTYGDMMTLLLTFFILLFSMSQIDEEKFKAFITSFSGAESILIGGESILDENDLIQRTNDLLRVKQELEDFIKKENLEDQVYVAYENEQVILRFDDVLLFDTGKADIKPIAVPVLSKIGTQLEQYIEQDYYIKFEGHTDNVPINTIQFPSNWELSAGRAIAVAKFFVDEMDFDPKYISTEGFGEYRPIASNETAEGRSMNRRVEIKLVKNIEVNTEESRETSWVEE